LPTSSLTAQRGLWPGPCLAPLLFCRVAGAQTDARFPSQITTADGTLYKDRVKLRVYPDGILVSYQPEPYGIGYAKLELRDLPESLQKQYGYDPKAAADFEKQEAQAADQFRAQLAVQDSLVRYRELAELHQMLAGSDAASYSVSLDANGKVQAQGFTGTPPSMTVTNVSMPSYVAFPVRNGLVTDYVPQQVPSSTVVVNK
jgi:hypothetical protein